MRYTTINSCVYSELTMYWTGFTVVILAEDEFIQSKLWEHGIKVQTMEEVRPLQVFPASVLTQIYSLLGESAQSHIIKNSVIQGPMEKMYLKFFFIMSPYMLASSDDLSSIWNGECGLRWMHTYIVIFIWSSNLLKKDNCESLTVQQVHVLNPLNFSLWLKISRCWLTSKFPDLFSVQCKTQLIILLK